MTTQSAEEPIYTERMATPDEAATRGKLLAVLGDDADAFLLLRCWVEGDGIRLGIESSDGLDVDDVRAMLRRALEAMPA